MCLVTLTVLAQGLYNTEFKAVKYCHKSKSESKWSNWEDINKTVVLNRDYIKIGGIKYQAMEEGSYYWSIDLRNCGLYEASAKLVGKGNGHYQLYLYYDNFSECYSLRNADAFAAERSQKRSQLSNREWILARWKGNGNNYIYIYKNTITMKLRPSQAYDQYIPNIEYQVDGNKIITNLDDGTITIDRSNGCLYFRGVRYSYDE